MWRERGGWGLLRPNQGAGVCVVAAIGGGFCTGEHVRTKAAIIDGSLAAPVSVTHGERRRTATGAASG